MMAFLYFLVHIYLRLVVLFLVPLLTAIALYGPVFVGIMMFGLIPYHFLTGIPEIPDSQTLQLPFIVGVMGFTVGAYIYLVVCQG